MGKPITNKLFISCVALTTIFLPIVSPPVQAQITSSASEQPPRQATLFVDEGPEPLESQIPQIWVVRVYINSRQQLAEIAAWIEPWEVHLDEGYFVVGVSQTDYNRLLAQGLQVEIDHKLTERANRPLEYLPNQVTGIPGFACYRTVDETYATAQNIVDNYPNLAEWNDIGNSWEKITPGGLPGYDLMVLKLTNSAITGYKPKLFVMTAIHAREYATAELNTRFAEYLIENFGNDPDITWLLDYTEIHLLLHANPDGRKQAEMGLSWRKNTNENYCSPTSTSRGADLNRNFEFQWGCCNGSSGYECDTTYRGPSPASEPETQVIQNYVRSIFPDQRGGLLTDPAPDDAMGVFLDIHSYGKLVIWPWGFTNTIPPNGTALQTLGRKFAYFNDYEPEQAINLYPTDGTTDDFAYGELGLAAYTFELGTSYFQDCASFESTILPDNLSAMLYAAKTSRTPYMTPAGPDALKVTTTPNLISKGEFVTLEATINDTRFSNNNGTESSQNIASAEYTINTPPWETGVISHPMSAADGFFNSTVEDVTAAIDTTGLDHGRHTIFVRGQDTSGNMGAVSASFLYVINPATAPVLQGYVREAITNSALAATVSANGTFQTDTNPSTGFYQMYVISDTYDIQVTAENHGSKIVTGVTVSDGQTLNQEFSLNPICTVFSDNIESGNIGWIAQTPWTISTENSHSPTHSWTDSPGGNYGDYLNISLTSPSIDLSGISESHLDFWQVCDTEASYDYCRVEVSANGGTTWTEIAAYSGSNTQWENIILSVPMLDNQPNIRIRFRLNSDSNITDDGWYLDDIKLTGAGEICTVAKPPTAGFNTSSPDLLGSTTVFTNTSNGSNLHYYWNFGDASPIITDTNPTHLYDTAGFYTVTLTVTNDLGTDSYSDVVEILDVNFPFRLGKTASAVDVIHDEIFTYTLSAKLVTTETNTYSVMMTDTLPVEVSVLTGSIRVDGIPKPEAYYADTHTIQYSAAGIFTEMVEVQITFLVQVGADVSPGTFITNRLYGQASLNEEHLPPPAVVEVSTRVVMPNFLPIVLK